jgi:protein-disulfide isomerase
MENENIKTINKEQQGAQVIAASIILGSLIIATSIIWSTGGFSYTGENNQKDEKPKTAKEIYQEIASDIGLPSKEFESCLAREDLSQRVTDDINEAVRSGAQGTPHFILVNEKGDLYPLNGNRPFSEFDSVIAQGLSSGNFTNSNSDSARNYRPVDQTDHITGSQNAKLTIIEFSDLECPYCKQVHPTIKQVMEKYSADVRWVYRHLPLSIHPNALSAAVASECAAELGGNDAFWQFIDAIFAL